MQGRVYRLGVTLIELLIAVLILTIAILLVVIGIRFLNELTRKGIQIDTDRKAQVLLNQITREMRVAQRLVTVSSTTLAFEVNDFSKGYDSDINGDLFNPTKIGTITYQYVKLPTDTYLLKTVDFPGKLYQQKLFQNILSTEVVGADYMFKVIGSSYGAEVVLKLTPGFYKRAPRVHKTNVTIRSDKQ